MSIPIRSIGLHHDINAFLKGEDVARLKLPSCMYCGEPIEQEDAVCLDIGGAQTWFCDACLTSNRKSTEE